MNTHLLERETERSGAAVDPPTAPATRKPYSPPKFTSGSHWPRITMVTPVFNGVRFIEDTIRSIVYQGYPNLEYIVVDGGSTDGTVDIIHKYEKHISWWISRRDKGVYDALNTS